MTHVASLFSFTPRFPRRTSPPREETQPQCACVCATECRKIRATSKLIAEKTSESAKSGQKTDRSILPQESRFSSGTSRSTRQGASFLILMVNRHCQRVYCGSPHHLTQNSKQIVLALGARARTDQCSLARSLVLYARRSS